MAAVVSSSPDPREHAASPSRGAVVRNAGAKGAADARGSRNPSSSCARAQATPKKRASNDRTSSEKRGARPRQNSLRRVKNSTDMLRERSLQQPPRGQKEPAPDAGASSREGKARQFTVANVGNNGMIYLRSVIHLLPFVFRSTPANASAFAGTVSSLLCTPTSFER